MSAQRIDTDWEGKFSRMGAFWRHSGNLKQPFAYLTPQKVTNRFFNADRVFTDPAVTEQAVGHLMHHPVYREAMSSTFPKKAKALPPTTLSSASEPDNENGEDSRKRPLRFLGVAYGGIILAYSAAHHGGGKCGYAIKKDDGSLSLGRCELHDGDIVVLVEDTISTGSTIRKLREAIADKFSDVFIVKCVLTLCNRSGLERIDDLKIAALFSPYCLTWKRGHNPFTQGEEQAEPVHPKPVWEDFIRL